MHYLFGPEGSRQLADTIASCPLLAFDFDGTLAPIVPLPDNARASLSVAAAMQRLCAVARVAVITGRAVADVRERLGFAPHYIIGNHGAEGLPGSDPEKMNAVVEGWLAQIAAHQEGAPDGVSVERKQYSLTLHYRLSRRRDEAMAYIERLLGDLTPAPERIGGKCVVNLMPPGAPNKRSALMALLKIEDAESAIFIGDDETDEAIFRHAPAHWLTIRVEQASHSAARYYIGHQSEIAILIQSIERQWKNNRESIG